MKKSKRKKTAYKGIRELLFLNKKTQKYTPASSGLRYQASRYEVQKSGKPKRVYCSFKTISEAKRWQSFLVDKQTALYKTPKQLKEKSKNQLVKSKGDILKLVNTNKYTLPVLFKEYKKRKFPFLSEATRFLHELHFESFTFLFDYEVQEITPEIIDEWVGQVTHPDALKGYKKSRINFGKELDSLRAVLNWYIKYKRISKWSNPVREEHYEMSQIRPKVTKSRNYMTEAEKNLWYKSLKEHVPEFYAPAFIQTEQVMRVSETFAMTWNNLDLNNKTYLLTHHIHWPRVKKPIPILLQGTKTQKEAFLMPLRKPVIDLLKKLEKEKSSPYIFHKKGNLYQYKTIQNKYNKAFKRAGLPFRSTHVCRHTGATQFLEKTGDPLALQEIGNWKSQRQSMHYGKVLKQRLRRAIDKMDREDFEYEN